MLLAPGEEAAVLVGDLEAEDMVGPLHEPAVQGLVGALRSPWCREVDVAVAGRNAVLESGDANLDRLAKSGEVLGQVLLCHPALKIPHPESGGLVHTLQGGVRVCSVGGHAGGRGHVVCRGEGFKVLKVAGITVRPLAFRPAPATSLLVTTTGLKGARVLRRWGEKSNKGENQQKGGGGERETKSGSPSGQFWIQWPETLQSLQT